MSLFIFANGYRSNRRKQQWHVISPTIVLQVQEHEHKIGDLYWKCYEVKVAPDFMAIGIYDSTWMQIAGTVEYTDGTSAEG